ncbi:potassium channel protein [Coraliomargarita parva]|uniref:potassium channel protein n=1 Tax=Coraliomargarita parva TaxID=3014050 RepID=UPI0022B5377A|nr:potassium channel protein [Coraliomargarita parva]
MIFFLRRWFANRERLAFKLVNALIVALLLNVTFGVLFYFAERNAQEGLTLVDSLWWAMVTMTTVGYGDFFATTWVGRFLVSYPCFILGIGIIGYLLGVVAEGMIDRLSRKRKGFMKIKHTGHIIICNCPHTDKVLRIADELRFHDSKLPIVVVADNLEENPSEFVEKNIDFVRGRPVVETIMLQANIIESSGIIILARDPCDPACDAESYATGSIVEQIGDDAGKELRTVVEVINPKNERMMTRARIDGLVMADGLSDRLLVQELLTPGSQNVFSQLLTTTEGSEIYTIDSSHDSGKFIDLQIEVLRFSDDVQIIGIVRQGSVMLNPGRSTEIEPGDRYIALARNRSCIDSFKTQLSEIKL